MRTAPDDAIGLSGFNGLSPVEAETALFACCSSSAWVARVVAARPYADAVALYDAAERALCGLGESDLDEALAGHPRIGQPATGWSRQEQAGLTVAASRTLQALAEGNLAYEQRFGHVYLVCANGLGAEELLSRMRSRLSNDPVAERAVMRRELAKINRLRLVRLIEGETP